MAAHISSPTGAGRSSFLAAQLQYSQRMRWALLGDSVEPEASVHNTSLMDRAQALTSHVTGCVSAAGSILDDLERGRVDAATKSACVASLQRTAEQCQDLAASVQVRLQSGVGSSTKHGERGAQGAGKRAREANSPRRTLPDDSWAPSGLYETFTPPPVEDHRRSSKGGVMRFTMSHEGDPDDEGVDCASSIASSQPMGWHGTALLIKETFPIGDWEELPYTYTGNGYSSSTDKYTAFAPTSTKHRYQHVLSIETKSICC